MANKLYSKVMSNSKHMATATTDEDNDLNDTDTGSEMVKIIDNSIYFYADVDSTSILALITSIKNLTKEHLITSIKYDIPPPPIKIYINSDGGELHSALAAFDVIRKNKVPIHTIIMELQCSAATIISLAGQTRKITQNSYMLIHNISSEFWGKNHEFEDEMKNMEMLTDNIKTIYKQNSNINQKRLDKLLKKDLLMDADTCLRLNLVDDVI